MRICGIVNGVLVNRNGVLPTVKFLTFEPVYIEQTLSFVFSFVRKDGSKQQLQEFL